MSTKRVTPRSTKRTTTSGFSNAERTAMEERTRELKAEALRGDKREQGEQGIRAKIKEVPEADRTMATRINEIVSKEAPHLMPKTWDGMPAWTNADGKIICYFQSASQFDARYATFGFNNAATLDDGAMWPTSFALTKITAAAEKQIRALVRQAAG